MSVNSNVIQDHIDKGDVDDEIKENGLNSDYVRDLTADTFTASTSTASPTSDNSDIMSNRIEIFSNNVEEVNKVYIKSLCDENSDSGVDLTENTLQLSDIEVSPSKNLNSENSHTILSNIQSNVIHGNESSFSRPNTFTSNSKVTTQSPILSSNIDKLTISNFVPNETKEEVTNKSEYTNNLLILRNSSYSDLNTINNSELSIVSLNDQSIPNNSLNKPPYSRSAENLSTLEGRNKEGSSLNSSENNLNAEKILSEFSNQKIKVAAMQKIPDTSPNLDVRYARIPKEILSQDIGSIVKNVHGILSSVSGSLKNAYTHRTTVQKPIKLVTNGKLMNDIFEDQNLDIKVEKTKDTESITNTSTEYFKSDKEGTEVEDDAKRDVLRLQIETLERMLAEQRKENTALRDRVKQHVDETQQKEQTFKELEVKLDMMSKRVEQAEREKDAAVMRYASVECTGIEAKRAAEVAAKNEKAALAEVELLNSKLRSAHAEKQRICQLYDDKCHDLAKSEREVGKIREELKELEGRLKWTQSKLRMEMDAYKESSERVEKLLQQVTELEASRDSAIANATDSAKAKQLESEVKETRAALIMCRHDKEELEKRLNTVTTQLDIASRERDAATCCLARLTAEVEELKASNLRLEEEAAELAALRAQAALADTLSAQLQRESARAAAAEEALGAERALAETRGRREAAALEHAARLTAQHVQHRAAAETHTAKAQALAVDNASLRERIASLEEENSKLQQALTEETDRRNKENRVLARKVAELTEELDEANKKLEWEKGENGVLRKKHASAIKELNRELQRTLKRCTQLEAKLPTPDAPSTRTGSTSSLSSGESAPQDERLQNGVSDTLPDIQVREPDRQALVERIVSLQRAAARRADRCEFLEEHAKQLTAELRSKNKLLRSLLCELPAGAVASRDRDLNKSEIARLGGGAMAAVWGGDKAGITLDLSLEMNKRLQAVLEDTLLKNITLKENMDTLGAEISRLKDQCRGQCDSK